MEYLKYYCSEGEESDGDPGELSLYEVLMAVRDEVGRFSAPHTARRTTWTVGRVAAGETRIAGVYPPDIAHISAFVCA